MLLKTLSYCFVEFYTVSISIQVTKMGFYLPVGLSENPNSKYFL